MTINRDVTDSKNRAAGRIVPLANTSDAAEASILLLATSGSSASFTLPAAWKGKYVTLRAIDQDLKYHVTVGAAGTVDYGLASAADGQGDDATLGKLLAAGETDDYQLPECRKVEDLFLNFEAAGVGSFEVSLSSR